MPKQFDRVYDLRIYDQRGSEIFKTNRLRVEFEIKKGIASVANHGKFTLYNLSQETRRKIREPFNLLTFVAGYVDFTGQIFTGDIKSIASAFGSGETGIKTSVTVRKETEVVTMIEAGDGMRSIQYGAASVSIAEGTSLKDTVLEVAKTMPALKIGTLNGLSGKKLLRSASFTGSTRLVLDVLGQSYGFTWSIQDGFLETIAITGSDQATSIGGQTRAYVIYPTNSVPELLDSGGIKVKSLLNPRIKPGRIVRVASEYVGGSGFYKIIDLTYSGDTDGDSWFIDIEGVPAGAQSVF